MTTAAEPVAPSWRLLPIVDVEAPPERLAMFRMLTGVFAVGYFVLRLPVFLELRDRSGGFDPVGVAVLLADPAPAWVVVAVIVVTIVAGIGYTVGWRFAVVGPIFAVGALLLTSYRGSWGQLLHFENLFVLHLLIVGLAPAADAWSLDARRATPRHHAATSYGWPLALAGLVVVITYVIAGIAKLRYGGIEWVFGDALRNHVAYSAARLDLLGGTPSPFAGWSVAVPGLLAVAAGAAVLVELTAPVALVGGRVRTAWVAAAWLMHVGILAFMLVGFPYPLFLVAFAPFFRTERLVWWKRGSSAAR